MPSDTLIGKVSRRVLSSNLLAEIDAKESKVNKGLPNGYAGLDSNGKIPLSLIPDVARQQVYIVADPAARDALTGLIAGDRCFELSTGDSYIWTGTAWYIMADADWANVSLEWVNIQGRPSSSVGDIDSAVALRHSHVNKSILDNTQESFTTVLKNKLDGIAAGATKVESSATNGNIKINGAEVTVYTHPATHPASIIEQTDDLTFVSNAERQAWNSKQPALGYVPVNRAGDTMNGPLTLSGAPTEDLHAATKKYVDDVAASVPDQYVHPDHTGDVTSVGDGATTIAPKAVTFSKMADVASSVILGRKSEGVGSVEALTASDVRRILNVADDADAVSASSTNGNILVNGAEVTVYTHPSTHPASIITQDSTHRFVTDAQIAAWDAKQDLLSGDVSSHYHGADRLWENIVGKPSTFTPSPHSHQASDVVQSATHRFVSDTQIQYWNSKQDPLTGDVTTHYHTEDRKWANITGKPSTFPPSSHTHGVGDIIDFPDIPQDTADLTKSDVYTKAEVDQKLAEAGLGIYMDRREEVFTATEGQEIFNLTQGTYDVGMNLVQVFVNGVRLNKNEFTEIDSSTVKTPPLEAGDEVIITYAKFDLHPTYLRGNITITFSEQAPASPSMGDLWISMS